MASALDSAAAVNEPWALKDLPPFPWITTKVLQLYGQDGEDINIRQLTELIRADASLSSELLRRANSALFGFRAQVASVERAITMIGLERLKSLALTLGVGTYVRAALKLTVLRQCWRHSLGCALLAEELAEACSVRPDQAYTAGLLHDVGRLALLVKYPQSYADLLSVVAENDFEMLQSERDLFDLDHCEAGAWLGREWNFPETLVEVMGGHHSTPAGPAESLPWLLHLSCRLADSLGFAAVEPLVEESPAAVLAELPRPVHLDEADIAELKRRITTRVNALE